MATYGYARVSTAEQAEDDRTSLSSQRRKIEGIAHAADWPVAQIFVEEGASGSIPFQLRPEGGKLWALLQPGDRLIAAKLDRLFRSAADALGVADSLARRDIALVLLDMGVEPVNMSASGRLFFNVLAVMAEFERSRIKERMLETSSAKRKAGLHLGGAPPFGFTIEGSGREARLVPDARQQEAIATMRAMRQTLRDKRTVPGQRPLSLRTIQDAVRDKHGFAITHQTVKSVLKREGVL